MYSDKHDLTDIITNGNICLWHMLIVITQKQKCLRLDNNITPMLNEAKSLAASLSGNCPINYVYSYLKASNVLGVFSGHEHITNAWLNYCDAIAMALDSPLEAGCNTPLKPTPVSIHQYIGIGLEHQFISLTPDQQFVVEGECAYIICTS